MAPKKSLIDLLDETDTFPYPSTNPIFYQQHVSSYYHFYVSSYPDVALGYVLPNIALSLRNVPGWDVTDPEIVPRKCTLATGTDEPSRTAAMAMTTAAMRETKHWRVLDGWRDELYAVYGPGGEMLFKVERSASGMFGVVTYGIHMTVYQRDPETKDLLLWVPRRAKTKQTYPSMLDNSVAGGAAAGEDPFECMVRESLEEASLPEHVARKARAAGCVTYLHIRDERAGGESGLLQPECEYIYDLDLTGEKDENAEPIVCKPNDEEVEGFELMTVERVRQALADSEFKPNCALVVIDFLIRHGYITKENERNFAEICARCHRRLDFPMG